MPQLFGFLLAVIGAILVVRWLGRQQAVISKTLDEVAKTRKPATRKPETRKIETLEQGEDGVFRPMPEDRTDDSST